MDYKSFGLSGSSKSTRIIFIIYSLGSFSSFPITGFISDKWGRRVCIVVGCLFILLGTGIQTATSSQNMFMGGRFILGFGAALAQASGLVYIVEIAHPSYHGIQAGIIADSRTVLDGWTTYGCSKNLGNSWAWRIPTLVQCFLPSVVLVSMFFLPETPLWLIAHDRQEETAAIFAKYHCDSDIHHPLLATSLPKEGYADNRESSVAGGTGVKELAEVPAGIFVAVLLHLGEDFVNLEGDNVVSYFMPMMLKAAGITNSSAQLLLTAINPFFSLAGAVYGSTLLDKLGRRKMLFYALLGALCSYIALTAFTAESVKNSNLVYGVFISIYVFGIFFAWGWKPLQVLYPVECLENRTRAKGAGVKFVFTNIATMTNTYGISVGIDAIGSKLYLVYIGWICVEMAVVFFFFVETAGKTLEEMTDDFESKNPVKKSLEKTILHEDGRVVGVENSKGFRL